MSDEIDRGELLALTTEIVASHVSNNDVPVNELPQLIKQIYGTLSDLTSGADPAVAEEARPRPAVSIKNSVTPDHIVCLEDGKKLKMLKRHLMTSYKLTPDQYRQRWGLPADYPMVAPNYAKQRSQLAKKIGLGTRPRRR